MLISVEISTCKQHVNQPTKSTSTEIILNSVYKERLGWMRGKKDPLLTICCTSKYTEDNKTKLKEFFIKVTSTTETTFLRTLFTGLYTMKSIFKALPGHHIWCSPPPWDLAGPVLTSFNKWGNYDSKRSNDLLLLKAHQQLRPRSPDLYLNAFSIANNWGSEQRDAKYLSFQFQLSSYVLLTKHVTLAKRLVPST